MEWEMIAFLIVFGLAILSKLISYKLNSHKILKEYLKIIKDLGLVVGQYLGFLTGWGITSCFINNKNICGISELNYIIVSLGIIMICASLVSYIYVITKDFKKKK
jgi:hypothetical protein